MWAKWGGLRKRYSGKAICREISTLLNNPPRIAPWTSGLPDNCDALSRCRDKSQCYSSCEQADLRSDVLVANDSDNKRREAFEISGDEVPRMGLTGGLHERASEALGAFPRIEIHPDPKIIGGSEPVSGHFRLNDNDAERLIDGQCYDARTWAG